MKTMEILSSINYTRNLFRFFFLRNINFGRTISKGFEVAGYCVGWRSGRRRRKEGESIEKKKELPTFSQANKTGAVARPNFKSAAVGFPIASADETKSRRSSTNWKASPIFLPYWNATSDNDSSAPANIATCKKLKTWYSASFVVVLLEAISESRTISAELNYWNSMFEKHRNVCPKCVSFEQNEFAAITCNHERLYFRC